MSTNPVVATRDLRKAFESGETVLDGVDFTAYENDVTVLMGPNGSGKTVLLACLAGGLSPSAGDVTVFGAPPWEVRSAFAFMLQDALAIPRLTGRENAEFFAALHPEATEKWTAIADRLGLDALNRQVREYSGGMVRKLELAVTLSVDVPLYLLDEPTAELDLTTIDSFHALVDDAVDRGRSVVMTSHTPRDARTADRLVFMRAGQIVTSGEPEALLEAVPPVVRLTDNIERDRIADNLLGGQLFKREGERRGFLAEEPATDSVRDTDTSLSIHEPTYADAFNYYVHIYEREDR